MDKTHYNKGDFIVYKGVGAYRNNMTPFFINARPAIVSVKDKGEIEVVRPKQTTQEMIDLLKY